MIIVSSKKKILHIVEAFGGGIYTFLVPLVNTTCEEFDITIAYGLRPQTPDTYKDEIDSRIQLIKGENFRRNLSFTKDIKSLFEIRRIVKQVKPDIIHLHSSKSGFVGRLSINCKKYKVFYSPHGYAFLKEDDSKLKRFFYYTMEKLAAYSNCTTIGVSKSECKIAKKLSKRAIYINNGIQLYNKTVLPAPINTKEPTICTIGRICYQKNPELFNSVAKAFPKLKFIWIGDGEMRDTLASENITVTGWLNRHEVLDYLKSADIFLLASYWEGLPISLLEAMYEGKICIASPISGICDVIEHGTNGFLAKELKDYVTIINEIRNQKYDVNQITKHAFNDILTTYNTDVMTKEFIDLYEQ